MIVYVYEDCLLFLKYCYNISLFFYLLSPTHILFKGSRYEKVTQMDALNLSSYIIWPFDTDRMEWEPS